MNETRMVYRPDGFPVSFEWHGGAYIDVYSMETGHSSESLPTERDNGGTWERKASQGDHPFTCINVWDYAKDIPTIPVTRESFEKECDEWLADPDNRRDYGL